MLGTMFWLAIMFFIIAIVAWLVGARGIAGVSEARRERFFSSS